MKKNITICLLFFAGFWIAFIALQNEKIYFNTLGKISSNYVYLEDGMRGKEKKPYEKITNENVLNWDGVHYYSIKEDGYSIEQEWKFAFFPLFSYIWKLSTLSPSKVIFLNFSMFMLGLLLLAFLFKQKWKNTLLLLSLPMFVVFLIPYTEATFFLMFSVAVWGYMKDKYWLYFAFMVLASLSRNTILLVFPAILCAEILFFISERNVWKSLFRLSMGSLPVLVGTAFMSLIQYFSGSEGFFKFIEVQKYWGHTFSLPDLINIRDWSHESFGINVPTLIMIGVPLIVYLTGIFLKQVNILKKNTDFFSFSSQNKSDYLNIVLLFCCLSAFFSVFFFQQGCLNGLSRYVLCSPYFVILLFLNQEKILSISLKKRLITFFVLAVFSFAIFPISSYCSTFNFSYLGYFIFVGVTALYLFKDTKKQLAYTLFLFAVFLTSILWTTYLYNMYLCNGWLYT